MSPQTVTLSLKNPTVLPGWAGQAELRLYGPKGAVLILEGTVIKPEEEAVVEPEPKPPPPPPPPPKPKPPPPPKPKPRPKPKLVLNPVPRFKVVKRPKKASKKKRSK